MLGLLNVALKPDVYAMKTRSKDSRNLPGDFPGNVSENVSVAVTLRLKIVVVHFVFDQRDPNQKGFCCVICCLLLFSQF